MDATSSCNRNLMTGLTFSSIIFCEDLLCLYLFFC